MGDGLRRPTSMMRRGICALVGVLVLVAGQFPAAAIGAAPGSDAKAARAGDPDPGNGRVVSRPAIEIGLPPVADGLNATVGDPSITLPATRSEVTAPRTITPVKSLWTEHSQTVANPDGSFSLVTAAGNKLTMVADPRFDQPASGNGNDLRHSRLGK